MLVVTSPTSVIRSRGVRPSADPGSSSHLTRYSKKVGVASWGCDQARVMLVACMEEMVRLSGGPGSKRQTI